MAQVSLTNGGQTVIVDNTSPDYAGYLAGGFKPGTSATSATSPNLTTNPTTSQVTQAPGTYGAPQPISADNINLNTQPLNITSPEPTTSGADSAIAGASTATKTLDQYIKELTPPKTAEQLQADTITAEINKLLPQTGGQADALAAEEKARNVEGLSQQLSQINSDITNKSAEYNQLKADYERAQVENRGKVIPMSQIIGNQAQIQFAQASALNQKAADVGLSQAMALGLQGQLENAQAAAKRAVDLKYSAIEEQLNIKLQQLQILQPTLDKQEKIVAEALTRKYNDEQQAIAEQKANQTSVYNLMISNPKAGILGTDSIAEATKKASTYLALNGGTSELSEIGYHYDESGNKITDYGWVDKVNQTITPYNSSGTRGNTNLGVQVGTMLGLPTYNTAANNPGMVRAVRNSNPGNIKATSNSIKYAGVVGIESTPAADGGNFLVFSTPEDGLNAVGKLLQSSIYSGLTAEKAIKKYNGGGSYGATQLNLIPNQDFQSQIKDPIKLQQVVKNMAMYEGFTQSSSNTVDKTSTSVLDKAQTIFNGTGKLSDVSTKNDERAKVGIELEKLKQNALKTGDVYGIIRASAGGKDVDATFIQSFEKGLNVVNQIADLQGSIDNQATGPITGIIRSNNPYDTKAQLIKAQLQAIVPNLARGVYGEVGVLTDNDIKNYAQTLPNLKSTEEVRKAILGITIRSVQRSLENKLKVAAGAGRDVSGLLSVYQQVESLATSLLGQGSQNKQYVSPTGSIYNLPY